MLGQQPWHLRGRGARGWTWGLFLPSSTAPRPVWHALARWLKDFEERGGGGWAGVGRRLQDSEEGRVWARVTGLFWMFHLKEVLRTCLGLLCGYRDWACHPGRVGTRKRREGRAPNTSAPRGWGQEGPRVTKPTGGLLDPAGSCSPRPCPYSLAHSWEGAGRPNQLGHLARVGSGSCGQWGGKRRKAHRSSLLCAPHCRQGWRKTYPLASDVRARSSFPLPCPYCSSPSPALCTVAGSPGGESPSGVWLSGMGQGPGSKHGGGGRWGVVAAEAPYSSLESLVVWLCDHPHTPMGSPCLSPPQVGEDTSPAIRQQSLFQT